MFTGFRERRGERKRKKNINWFPAIGSATRD